MRPWQHARASAARGARAWSDDLAIHEFMDCTKASLGDLRHRMVLHSCDLGPALAAMAFAERPHAESVARDHAREDLGADVPLSWWLDRCLVSRFPRQRANTSDDELIERATERFGLDDDRAARAVLSVLTLPERLAPSHGRDARCVLGNEAGVAIVRAVLGPAREIPTTRGKSVVFDPAYCAEMMVHRWFRRIPSLRELADALGPDAQLHLDDLRSRRARETHTPQFKSHR